MSKATWHSTNAISPSNVARTVAESPSPSPGIDDQVPDSWRPLIEAAPKRLPREAERPIAQDAAAREIERPVARAATLRRQRLFSARTIAIALAVVALLQSALMVRLMLARRVPVAAAPSVAVTITSGTAGDAVTIDGRQIGVTPYPLRVDGSMHEIRVLNSQAPLMKNETALDSPAVQPAAAALVPNAPRSGGLRLSAPVDVQVLDGERVLGSSADGPVVTTAGVHEFDLVNSEIGYRERRRVEIKAGQIVALTVTPPNGRLNVNALPWAQIWIDGKEAGETPLANVSLSGGPHDVVFRHPQLGERTERVLIKSGGLTRLSITLGR
jgi:hypothetical protein